MLNENEKRDTGKLMLLIISYLKNQFKLFFYYLEDKVPVYDTFQNTNKGGNNQI